MLFETPDVLPPYNLVRQISQSARVLREAEREEREGQAVVQGLVRKVVARAEKEEHNPAVTTNPPPVTRPGTNIIRSCVPTHPHSDEI